MLKTRAHGTRKENERRTHFLGKWARPSRSSGGNPGGVTRGFFFPSPAAPPSWWNSPVRAAKVSATCPESTWGFSQATSWPWSKAFWSEWWTALHPTNPCAWRTSARPVSPLHGTSAEVAPSSRQSPNQLMGGPGPALQAANSILPAGAGDEVAMLTILDLCQASKKECLFGTTCPILEAEESFPFILLVIWSLFCLLTDSFIFPSKF